MDNYHNLNSGTFEDALDEVKRLDVQLAQQLNLRDQKLKSNENTIVMDKQLGRLLTTYDTSIKDIVQLLNELKSTLSPAEIQRRTNTINDYRNHQQQYQQKLATKSTLFKSPQTQPAIEMGDMQQQQQHFNRQEEHIDQMLKTADGLKVVTKQIGQQLDEDKIILRRLEENVDQATHDIKITDSRMKKLLEYTSDCCLWSTIIIEFMIFIFLIIY